MAPSEIKQLTPNGYGGDFEMTGQIDDSMLQKCDKSAVFACKNVINDPVLFNGKDIRTVYPISTFSGTTQDELVELIRRVQVRAQVEVQDEMTMEVGE